MSTLIAEWSDLVCKAKAAAEILTRMPRKFCIQMKNLLTLSNEQFFFFSYCSDPFQILICSNNTQTHRAIFEIFFATKSDIHCL